MRTPALLCAALLSLVSARAFAQANFVARDLTRGVTSPGGRGVAGDFDANASTVNPAGLGTLASPHFAFTATAIDEDSVVGGGGWALSIGFPVVHLGGENPFTLTYGFGFQALDAPRTWTRADVGAEDQDGSYLVNGVGIGLGPIALGYSIGTYFWSSTPQTESMTTHHAGISIRPWRFAALGMTVRDVFEPVGRVAAEKLTASYDVELALRPFGDSRLEVAGGALIGTDERVDARARAIVTVLRGLSVFAQYESVERAFADGAERDHRVFAGLTVNGIDGLLGGGGHMAVSYGGVTSARSDATYAGSSVMVSYAQERYPAIREPVRFVEVELDTDGDREFVHKMLELRTLERDAGVSGVLLTVWGGDWGYARAEEIRRAVARLRAAGKKTIAYLRQGDMGSYYAASACDRVLLHPAAPLELHGFAWQGIYLANLLERLGVEAQVFQIAEYKSFGEAFTRTSPSDADREQIKAYLADVSAAWRQAIALDRHLDAARLAALLGRVAIPAREAVTLGLADRLAHPDELEDEVEKLLGAGISLERTSATSRHPRQWAYPRIAVIYVDDSIPDGPSKPNPLSSAVSGDDIADAVAEARRSPMVEAIVLRVNSPGGAVQASERIAREVELTRTVKPIIVSMGDVAASGGYMAAAHGDRIFAQPSTLTGSIGIVGVHFDLTGLATMLGVTTSTEKLGDHADMNSIFRRWTDAEQAAILTMARDHYDRFVALVARGRSLSPTRVEQLARGRIWSGTQARTSGLIDQYGSIADAMDEARHRAGIAATTEIEVVHWPHTDTGLAGLLTNLSAAVPRPLARLLSSLPSSLWHGDATLAELPWRNATGASR